MVLGCFRVNALASFIAPGCVCCPGPCPLQRLHSTCYPPAVESTQPSSASWLLLAGHLPGTDQSSSLLCIAVNDVDDGVVPLYTTSHAWQ
jgi:hypothetical protein